MMKTSAIVMNVLCMAMLGSTSLAAAADVTPQRLANPEPQNWLMNHRTYDGQAIHRSPASPRTMSGT
jgi:hypothetical protein